MRNIKKILFFFSLLVFIVIGNIFPVIQINNFQNNNLTESNNNLQSININYQNSIFANSPEEHSYDFFKKELVELNLTWEKVKSFTSAVATKYFIHEMVSGTTITNKIELKIITSEESKIVFYGRDQVSLSNQVSTVSISVSFYKYDSVKDNVIVIQFIIYMDAHTINGQSKCGTLCFIDKINLR